MSSKTTVFQTHRRKIFISLLALGCFVWLSYHHPVDKTNFPRIPAEDDGNMRKYPDKTNGFLASELLIDRNQQSQADIVRKAQRVLPNFPISFWEKNKNGSLRPNKSKSCAVFPKVYDLHVNNLYWQILPVNKGNIYLFSAFYDVRERCLICPAIRVLAMVEPQAIIPSKAYCQMWFDDNKEPIIVEGQYDRLHDSSRLDPYMISCSVRNVSAERIPIFVSIVNEQCDLATNSLRVIFDQPADGQKGGFAVCVKNSDFLHVDLSVKLTEWIEMVQLLGGEKITLYPLHIHQNMTKVLKYYEERGVVEIIPITLAGNQANAPYFQHMYFMNTPNWVATFGNEVLEVNDCFYRNMYKYNYIAPFDIDEVIMPNRARNWADLMNDVLKLASSSGKNGAASYNTYMVMFPNCPNVSVYNDIPTYMYMLQHVLADRGDRIIDDTVKSFLDTEITVAAQNHHAIRSFTGIERYDISREVAELYHYRSSPYNVEKSWRCESLAKNENLWRYKESLINRTLAALYNLGFYGQGH